jgi:hypothetical protein
MPVLELKNWQRRPESTWLQLREMMLFPEDAHLRRMLSHQRLLKVYAEREKKYDKPYILGGIPQDFFANLSLMMDMGINEQVKTRAAYGEVTGFTLQIMKQMSFSHPVSRAQAFKLFRAVGSERTPWGRIAPKADRTLRDAWKTLASVSHLWAAVHYLAHVARINKTASKIASGELTSPGTFPFFLGIAHYFFEFGASTCSDSRTIPILSRQDAWQIDIGVPIPGPREIVDYLSPGLPVEAGELVWPLQPEDLAWFSADSH